MAAASAKFRCFVCHLVSDSGSQLHYHQMFSHSLEELSISVISLQGLLNHRELSSGRAVCDEMLLESLLKYPQLVIYPIEPSNPANCSLDRINGEGLFAEGQKHSAPDVEIRVKREEEIYLKKEKSAENELCTSVESSIYPVKPLSPANCSLDRLNSEGLFAEGQKHSTPDVETRVKRKEEICLKKEKSAENELCTGMESSIYPVKPSSPANCSLDRLNGEGLFAEGQKHSAPDVETRVKREEEICLKKEKSVENELSTGMESSRENSTCSRRPGLSPKDDQSAMKWGEELEGYAEISHESFLDSVNSLCVELRRMKGSMTDETFPRQNYQAIIDASSSVREREFNGIEEISHESFLESVRGICDDLIRMRDRKRKVKKNNVLMKDGQRRLIPKKAKAKLTKAKALNSKDVMNDECSRNEPKRERRNESLLEQNICTNIPIKEEEMEFHLENERNLIEDRTSSGLSKQSDQGIMKLEQEMESQEIPLQEAIVQDDILNPEFLQQGRIEREQSGRLAVNEVENYNDACTQVVNLREETVEAYEGNESSLQQGVSTDTPIKEEELEFHAGNEQKLNESRTSSGLSKQSDQDGAKVEQEMEIQEIPIQETILQSDILYSEYFPYDGIETERSDSFTVYEVEHCNDACTQVISLREDTVETYEESESLLEQGVCANIEIREKSLLFDPDNEQILNEGRASSGLSQQSDQDGFSMEQEMKSQEVSLQDVILQYAVWYPQISPQGNTRSPDSLTEKSIDVDEYSTFSSNSISIDSSRMKKGAWKGKWPRKKGSVRSKGKQSRSVKSKLAAVVTENCKEVMIKNWSTNETEREQSESDTLCSREETVQANEENESFPERDGSIPIKKEALEFYPENKENLNESRTSSGLTKQSDQDDFNVEREMESQEIPLHETILQNPTLFSEFFLQDNAKREKTEGFPVIEVENYNDACKLLVAFREETVGSYEENDNLPQERVGTSIPIKHNYLGLHSENKTRIESWSNKENDICALSRILNNNTEVVNNNANIV